jgi:cytochrome b involved in lipid metabolism
MNQFFDTIGGLPLHPLTVHAASVLIPLSAIALVLLVFVPKWRKAYLPLTIGSLAVSVGLAFAAKQSGEALAARVGNPGEHQELGDLLFPASIGLFALGLAFYFFTKTETKTPKWTLQLAGGLSTAAVAGVVILSVLVGHSGAEATWGNRLTANPVEELVAPTEPVPGATDGSTGGTTGGTSSGGITVAEVLKHNTATDCWSVVNGNVYDLTSYVSQHKGGEAVIKAICGKDGTKSFSGQHAGASKPNADLSSLLVGALATSSSTGGTSSGSGTTGTTPGLGTTVALTAAEVLKHSTGKDCWSVIKGEVYDLTAYVKDHPGGANLIKAICGKDGSTSFASQHAGAAKPKNILAAFALGPLVSGSTLPEATVRGDEEGDEEEDEEGDDD